MGEGGEEPHRCQGCAQSCLMCLPCFSASVSGGFRPCLCPPFLLAARWATPNTPAQPSWKQTPGLLTPRPALSLDAAPGPPKASVLLPLPEGSLLSHLSFYFYFPQSSGLAISSTHVASLRWSVRRALCHCLQRELAPGAGKPPVPDRKSVV